VQKKGMGMENAQEKDTTRWISTSPGAFARSPALRFREEEREREKERGTKGENGEREKERKRKRASFRLIAHIHFR